MTSPEEEQRKRTADAKAKEPEKPSEPHNDALGFVGQLVGDARNQVTDAVLGTHSGEKVLSGITPQLAAQYQRGKEVQERMDNGSLKQSQLTDADRSCLDAFNNVRKTISQVPMYDRDSLMRYVEKGIEQKAKTAPPETSKPAPVRDSQTKAEATKPEAAKPAGQNAAKDTGDPKKTTAQLQQPVHKDIPGSVNITPDSKMAGSKSAQPWHPVETQVKTQTHPAEAKAQTNKTEPPLVTSIHESKADNQRGVSPPAHREAPTAQDGAPRPADVTKSRNSEPHLNTDRSQKESLQPQERSRHTEFGTQAAREEKQAAPGNKSLISNTSAAGTFERRTAYDARTQQEVRHQPSGANAESHFGRTNLPGDSQNARAKAPPEARNFSAAKLDSFANMRRVLEERTATAGNLPQRSRFSEQQQIKTQTKMEAREALPSNYASERRATLFEYKISLSRQSMEQIAHTSDQRFPSGLRWQNTLGHPDAALAGPRSERISQTNSVKANESMNGTARENQNQSGVVRNVQSSTVRDSQSGTVRDSQSGTVRDSQSGTVRDSQSGAIRNSQSGSVRDQQIGSARSNQSGFVSSPEGKSFTVIGRLENRYITGAEIALAAVIAAAGAKRVRIDQTNQPAVEISAMVPRVQKIDAFLPNQSKALAPSKPDAVRTNAPQAEVIKSESSRSEIRTDGLRAESRSDSKAATFTSTFKASEKRFLTGAEIALAAVIASCGSARIRQNLIDKTPDSISQTDDLRPGLSHEIADAEISGDKMNQEESSPTGDEYPSELQVLKTNKDKGENLNSRDEPQAGDEANCDDDIPGTLRYLQKHKYNRQTILIGPGDTLVGIADAVWENRNLGWLIADINIHRIKQTFLDGKRIVEVRSRQMLDLPSAQDIKAFCRHRKEDYKPENLVTIVIETQIDRELLDAHLGVFVEGGKTLGAPSLSPGARANPSLIARTSFGADGSALSPSLALESAGILKVATDRLVKLTGSALERGRKRFSKLKDGLDSDKIKRRI